ncbi:uncharacterized protein PHALS_08274 [Plasmopara halstedii]|uniref:Uncharacterized protein n=1 Tax=Plasmopara halstedii TaxID=4781 RepID=A0A0N7L4B2_PLAHL|nr:uncharacterized protein PHALS_08274 [Plasmopara halstedii]CEG38187.1 hypothetical protein PHALS_08274 [Plasmopara halstedii]|eukprot:XP_024574556.1 hypothetical protein PHALS_08274 [Plasmopara halstedii]
MLVDVNRELRLMCDVSPTMIELVRHTEKTCFSTSSNALARWRHLRVCMGQLTRGLKRSRQRNIQEKGERLMCCASILHKDFWLEALDNQHRYGFHLRAFHKAWKHEMAARTSDSKDTSFFYWLDHGNGRNVNLPECTQHGLRTTRVEYCNAEQRKNYLLNFFVNEEDHVVRVRYAVSGCVVHTDKRSKWIFVIDLSGSMYLGRKRKGHFHHSSFVSGAPIFAAGKITIENGIIIAVEPHSGHFKPRLENLEALCSILANQGVAIENIVFIKPKKWTCVWPFPPQPHFELEEFVSVSDTDCGVDKSDGEESVHEHEL